MKTEYKDIELFYDTLKRKPGALSDFIQRKAKDIKERNTYYGHKGKPVGMDREQNISKVKSSLKIDHDSFRSVLIAESWVDGVHIYTVGLADHPSYWVPAGGALRVKLLEYSESFMVPKPPKGMELYDKHTLCKLNWECDMVLSQPPYRQGTDWASYLPVVVTNHSLLSPDIRLQLIESAVSVILNIVAESLAWYNAYPCKD